MIITSIADENIHAFIPLVPDGMLSRCDLLLGAIEDDTACGILGARLADNGILDINLLYVSSSYRKRGAATQLLQSLIFFASRYGMNQLAISFSENDDDCSGAMTALMNKLGFEKKESDSGLYFASLDTFAPLLSKDFNFRGETISLDKCLSKWWREFCQLVSEQDQILLQPMNSYDTKASFLIIENEKCHGGILINGSDGVYTLSYLLTAGTADPKAVFALLKAGFNELRSRNESDTGIIVNAINEASEKLFKKLSANNFTEVGKAVNYYYNF